MQPDTPDHPTAVVAIPDAPSMETARLRLMLAVAGRAPSVDDLKRLLVSA